MRLKRSLGFLALVAVLGLLGWWWVATSGETAQAADPAPQPEVPVKTAQVKVQEVPVMLNGLGTVQALNVVEIKAQVNGTLIALPAREGQEVHKDDIVAEIDPRPYKAALDQAIAQRNEDAAMLRSAQLDLVRYQKLAKQSFAPIQQVDDQQATVDKQTAAVAVDDAMIETAQINLGYCVIRAPMDGRVSLYQLNVGNLVEVASQTGIVSITQDKPISVVFTLPEADLAQLQAARARGAVPVEVTSGENTAAGDRDGHVADTKQYHRHDHRNDLAEGELPQSGRASLARAVRQCPGAGGHAEECGDRSGAGDPARAGRPVRLCHQARRLGRSGRCAGGVSGRSTRRW